MSNELIVYCIGTFVYFFSFHFFFLWDFSVYKLQICFGFKNFFFFLSTNFMPAKSWISVGIYRNTRNRLKWPKIFSKWNRNTLDKIYRVTLRLWRDFPKNTNKQKENNTTRERYHELIPIMSDGTLPLLNLPVATFPLKSFPYGR